jgi:putative hydrolase of the HAD superfamily
MSVLSKKIEIVTLDLDNTLWDVETTIIQAEKDMRAWMAKYIPAALDLYKSEEATAIRNKVVAENADKVHDLTFLRVEVLFNIISATQSDKTLSRKLAQEAFAVFFKGRNNVAFFPYALKMLEQLSEKYTLFALTNGNADVEQVGIDKYLAGAVSSADVGASKPSPRMFEAVLDMANIEAHQAIHVGDHLVDDIQGAHEAGMHTLWVNLSQQAYTDENTRANIEVNSLSDLPLAIESYQQSLSTLLAK